MKQSIGLTRLSQRTASSKINANFTELYTNIQVSGSLAAAAAGSFVVPAGFVIQQIALINTTANTVTGGIKLGTTAGATDVVAAQAVGANAVVTVADANILKRVFSKTVDQTVFFDAITAWNSAVVDIRITLRNLYA